MDSTVIERMKKHIAELEPSEVLEKTGRVISAGDGIVEIEGLPEAMMSEMIVFAKKEASLEEMLQSADALYGLVLNLEEDTVKAVVLGDTSRVAEGMLVKGLGKVLSIPVSEAMMGRVVNPLGEPIDGRGPIESDTEYPIERIAYGVIDRAPVNTPVHTGIKAIDGMIPIGRGQRELIIGDRFTGKTTIVMDTFLNQKYEPAESRPICIYVAIGQKESKVARMVADLRERGAMEYTIVVSASAATPAALQFLAPFAGAAIGEYFMERGKDAIIAYDDLSKHAVAYREISLLLRRPPGREAYPGDIFYLHSRLLERAAKLNEKLGGGSLTALPIIETQEGDVSAYIPTNVISITDGQIFLEGDLFNKGTRPAINVGISVSRVGSSAQTKAMKKVAGKIRLQLAQFRELEAFMQFSSDLDPDTKQQIESGRRLSEILKQGKNKPLSFERQVPAIYAAVHGFFETVPVERMGEAEEKFLEFLDREYPGIIATIRTEKDITEETDTLLKEALVKFKEMHGTLFEAQS